MVLAAFSLFAIAKEWQALSTSFASIGPVVVAFNVISLLAAYCRSRAMGLNQSIVTAISFDIGIHNSLLAILWLCLGFLVLRRIADSGLSPPLARPSGLGPAAQVAIGETELI